MRRTLMFLALATTFALVGCSKKNSSNPATPIDGGSGGNEEVNVNFTMGLESGTQGMIFVASPSEDIRLARIEVTFPAQNFRDTVTNPDPQSVIQKGSRIRFAEYTGVEGGQQWVLVFYGTVATTGKAFTKKVNWTVV